MGQSLKATGGDEKEFVKLVKTGEVQPTINNSCFTPPSLTDYLLDITGQYTWRLSANEDETVDLK